MITITVENHRNVKDGIEFLLSHFEGRQRLFPRKMSTFASNGKQFVVYNKEQILDACIKSNFKDCRINAYPVLEDGVLQAPNIIFIDLDLQSSLNELNKNLNKTLKIIKQKFNGFEPTILWTGNGYHIYIVSDITPLELINELRELSDKPSGQFLRYAEKIFTNNKKDSQHNPSFKSCLLRIPGTLNSKNDSEVKIIKKFEDNNISIIDNYILREFRLYLADLNIKRKLKDSAHERSKKKYYLKNTNTQLISIPKCYKWIEDKLLKTPIPDYRKITVELVLVPYFINIKRINNNQTFHFTKEYLLKCHEISSLEPSVTYFYNKINFAIQRSFEKEFIPIKIENLKDKYPNWFNFFKAQEIFS